MLEISGDQRALNLRQRQVLIMIDGKRTQDDLEKHLNHLDVAKIVADLEQLGYIHDPESASTKHSPSALVNVAKTDASPVISTQPTEASTDTQKVSGLKEILLDSSKEYLGIMGQNITQRIEAAQSLEQLKGCISLWHMAIRESKTGKPVAGILMEQVQQFLQA